VFVTTRFFILLLLGAAGLLAGIGPTGTEVALAASSFPPPSSPPPPPPSRPLGGFVTVPTFSPALPPPPASRPPAPPPPGPSGPVGVAVTDPAVTVPNQVLALHNTAAEAITTTGVIGLTGYGLLGLNALPALNYVMTIYSLPPGVTLDNALVALQGQFPNTIFAPNNLYGLAAAGAFNNAAGEISWKTAAPSCGANIRIGMIDTQVDASVRTLKARTVHARSFVDDPRPPTNHGTQVATILVGATSRGSLSGLMPAGSLYSAGVFEHMANGAVRASTPALARAMDWLVGESVSVINLSFAGPMNFALLGIVQRASERNVILVGASGNDGPASPPLYPAAFPKVIAVTAVDANRQPYEYNVIGKHIAFTAPGVNLPLPVAEAGGKVDLISGTSFASPYAAAVVALWRLKRTDGGQAEAVKELGARAVRLAALTPDPVVGYGLIQSPGPCS